MADETKRRTEDDARFTAHLLMLLMAEVKRYKTKHLDKKFKINASGPNKLSERQFQILFFIEYLHMNTLSQISGRLELSDSSLSSIISKMVRNDLLFKKYPEHDDDKRKTYFYLTPEGVGQLHRFIRYVTDFLASFYEGLDKSRKESFLLAYERLMTFVPDDENETPEEHVLPQGDASQISNKIVNGLIKVSTTLERCYQCQGQEEEDKGLLSGNQMHALFFIDAKKINNLRELSQTIGISESALSITLSKMAAEGLVYKEYPEAEEDGRRISFYITEEGQKKLSATKKKIISYFVSFYHTLHARQQENLYEGIKNLYTIFREEPI